MLLLLNNGIFARRLGARLALLPPRLHSLSELPVPLRHMVMTSLALSQVGWWTAMFIGYLATAASR